MPILRKALAVAAAATSLAAPMLLLANPASADADRDGHCDVGDFCYYYNSNQAGSLSDHAGSEDDYGTNPSSCYHFLSDGAGQHLCIKNNAASVWNRTGKTVTVYYNSGYSGPSQSFADGVKANLNSTLKNENASHRFGSTSSSSSCSNAPGNPRTCAQAVAWANDHLGTTSSAYTGYCDKYVAVAYGYSASGSATAAAHWSQVPSTYKHAGSRSVPAGGLAFFSGGSTGAGHVMLSLGNGNFASTDVGSTGRYSAGHYNKTTIALIEDSFNETYLGWTQPWFNQ